MAQWLKKKKKSLAKQEMCSIPKEVTLEEEMATHSFACQGNPMDRGSWWATVHGVTKQLDMTW